MSKYYDISDDEIRVVGSGPSPKNEGPRGPRGTVIWVLAIAAVLLVIGGVFFFLKRRPIEPNEPGLFESGDSTTVQYIVAPEKVKPFGDYSDTTGLAYTEVIEKTVNDIPLSIYIPHNAVPELCLGSPNFQDKNIILTTQAADIRKDNKKIVGAFVLKGQPLAWGLSKKGYCGIIDGEITVGVADNSPLFEQATETDGYFFRQFALVDDGTLVENDLKNKSIRKALCERAGEVFVVKCETPESFHDFAQALVDLGVNDAIYLVGSTSYGFWYDKAGDVTEFSDLRHSKYKYESYILWRAK